MNQSLEIINEEPVVKYNIREFGYIGINIQQIWERKFINLSDVINEYGCNTLANFIYNTLRSRIRSEEYFTLQVHYRQTFPKGAACADFKDVYEHEIKVFDSGSLLDHLLKIESEPDLDIVNDNVLSFRYSFKK